MLKLKNKVSELDFIERLGGIFLEYLEMNDNQWHELTLKLNIKKEGDNMLVEGTTLKEEITND